MSKIHISAVATMIMLCMIVMPISTSEAERGVIYKQYITSTHKSVDVTITYYTSRTQETDDTPFITADGTRVRHGIVALSRDLFEHFDYGDSLYAFCFDDSLQDNDIGWLEVRDCMNKRWTKRIDIWVDDYNYAMICGRRKGRIMWDYNDNIEYIEVEL